MDNCWLAMAMLIGTSKMPADTSAHLWSLPRSMPHLHRSAAEDDQPPQSEKSAGKGAARELSTRLDP
jgi:hypothetical protein